MRMEEICRPIRAELQKVDREIQDRLDCDNEFIRRINEYITGRPGKKIRPALILFSAKMGGTVPNKAVLTAAAVEMVHTAALIHDDVVDCSDKRRGQPTVRSKWKNGISVLLGDRWYSRAVAALSNSGMTEILGMLLEVVDEMCAGELEHLRRCYDISLEEREYLEIIENKTASLMAFCCEAGALLGETSPGDRRALIDYGLNLGMAFQIIDDCLDMAGTEKRMKKPLGNDLREGRITLPLVHVMRTADERDRKWIRQCFQSRRIDQETAGRVKKITRQCRAVEYALGKAVEYSDTAKAALGLVRDGKSRRSLELLADYVLERGLDGTETLAINDIGPLYEPTSWGLEPATIGMEGNTL